MTQAPRELSFVLKAEALKALGALEALTALKALTPISARPESR